MYIKLGDHFCDIDMDFLNDLLSLLDNRLEQTLKAIDVSFDPDQMGLFDECEYLVGIGFVACQRYINATFRTLARSVDTAFQIGPYHSGGQSYACLLNTAANYWKHQDEFGANGTVYRNLSTLDRIQRKNIEIIKTVTQWDDYACTCLLYEMTGTRNLLGLCRCWNHGGNCWTK